MWWCWCPRWGRCTNCHSPTRANWRGGVWGEGCCQSWQMPASTRPESVNISSNGRQVFLCPPLPVLSLPTTRSPYFVLGNTLGNMTRVRLGRVRGMTSVNTLAADTSYLGRVWTSLVRSGPASDQAGQPTGHVISPLPGVGLCLVAVCKDHKLRVWSLASYECIMASDLVQFTAEAGRQMMGGSQGHRVSLGMYTYFAILSNLELMDVVFNDSLFYAF